MLFVTRKVTAWLDSFCGPGEMFVTASAMVNAPLSSSTVMDGPKLTFVPMANEVALPALMRVTPASPSGTLAWLTSLKPQATTVPSARSARL